MAITKTGNYLLTKVAEKRNKTVSKEDDAIDRSMAIGASVPLGTTSAIVGSSLPAIPLALKYDKLKGKGLSDEEAAKIIKHLRPDGIKLEHMNDLGSHYDAISDTVRSNKNSYILAHELGHASGLLRNGRLGAFGALITHGIGHPIFASAVRGAEAANKAYNKAKGIDDGTGTKVLDAAGTGTQIASGLQLAEEAQASLRGLAAIKKVHGMRGALQAAKVLGPAFGTYLGGAIGAHALAPYIGERLGEYMAG